MKHLNALRVLVVDDERLVADTLVMIAKFAGHTARAAYSGEEAAQIADEFMPQVCVSDVMMPGMIGIELADWLEEHHPDCRLLLISGAVDTAALLDNPPVPCHLPRRCRTAPPLAGLHGLVTPFHRGPVGIQASMTRVTGQTTARNAIRLVIYLYLYGILIKEGRGPPGHGCAPLFIDEESLLRCPPQSRWSDR
jgi:CheY-like chemotaxis protein